jgi:hypothetical protein
VIIYEMMKPKQCPLIHVYVRELNYYTVSNGKMITDDESGRILVIICFKVQHHRWPGTKETANILSV